MKALQQVMRKVRLAFGLALVKLTDDARQIQQMQITALNGEVRSKVNRYQDYGFTSNPLDGAEGLIAAVGGNRNHLVMVRCDDGRYRKRNLAKGEVAMYTDEGDYILLKRGRIMEVVAGSKLTVNAPEVVITATTKVTVTTPLVEISNDLHVAGNITSDKTVTGDKVETAAGIKLGTHLHIGITPGGGTTGLPQP